MDNLIKQMIEEAFASKKQQKYFFAKSQDKDLSPKERKKWKKMASEFSEKTNFKKLPEKVKKEEEIEEIVDEKGNIARKKTPIFKPNSSDRKTSDEVVKTGAGSMGSHGVSGTHTSLRYWAESDMSKALGYEETLGKDKGKEDAEEYFKDDLGVEDSEAEERLSQMGYDDELADGKVRLIENPKEYIQDFIESILSKKNKDKELVEKSSRINPIILKQIKSLKNTLDSNNLSIEDIIKHFKDDE